MEEAEITYRLRDIDGTPLSVCHKTRSEDYQIDPSTGWRKKVGAEPSPLTITASEKPLLGQRIITEIGEMEVSPPLSPEYTKMWPDSLFVKKVVDTLTKI